MDENGSIWPSQIQFLVLPISALKGGGAKWLLARPLADFGPVGRPLDPPVLEGPLDGRDGPSTFYDAFAPTKESISKWGPTFLRELARWLLPFNL